MLLLPNLILTIVVEYLFLAACIRKKFVLLAVVMAGMELITHPFGAWLIYNDMLGLLPTEVIIVIFEAGIYVLLLTLPWKRAFLISVGANLASFGAGYVLSQFIVW